MPDNGNKMYWKLGMLTWDDYKATLAQRAPKLSKTEVEKIMQEFGMGCQCQVAQSYENPGMLIFVLNSSNLRSLLIAHCTTVPSSLTRALYKLSFTYLCN